MSFFASNNVEHEEELEHEHEQNEILHFDNYQPLHPTLKRFRDAGANPNPTNPGDLRKEMEENQRLWKEEKHMARHKPQKCRLGFGRGDWCPLGETKKWKKWLKDYYAIKKKAQKSSKKLKAMGVNAK